MRFGVALHLLPFVLLLPACSIGKRELPLDPPPLIDLEEPLDLREEPRDEDARRAAPAGSFTGIAIAPASESLDALASDEGGLAVENVVENSPADLAGVETGDLIAEVRVAGETQTPRWPSEWRALELATPSGEKLVLVLDRAGVERQVTLTTVPRARPGPREPVERFREEERAGVVMRTASEVEARAAGLGPGGGAVVVGLSRASPWRKAGLRFGDLIRAVDGATTGHPQVVIDAIRAAPEGGTLVLDLLRDSRPLKLEVRVTERESELRTIDIPLLFSYENDRGRSETSILFGLYKHESTEAAWRTRFLWFIEFSGGDADRLQEDPVGGASGAWAAE